MAIGANGKQSPFGIDHHHANNLILANKSDAFDTPTVSAKVSCIGFLESDGHARF